MSLPESKQDAALADTYEARPGASDITPAGLSSTHESLSTSVKSSLDTITQPRSASLTEQLPSAQAAADSVKAGANSLLAGISTLALGASDTVSQNASASHPESEKAHKVDDLHVPGAFADENVPAPHPKTEARKADDHHIPGAFDGETSDTEDTAAIKQGLQSAYNTLPSQEAIKNSLPDTTALSKQLQNMVPNTATAGSLTEQVQSGSRAVQSQVQQSVNYIREQLPGQQQESTTKKIHDEGIDHIKGKLREDQDSKTPSHSETLSAVPNAHQANHGDASATKPSNVSETTFPRVVGEPVDGGHSHESDVSFPRVVDDTTVASHSIGVDLQSGVHNGVVGDHLDDDSKSHVRPVSGSHSGHWQPGTSATVAHIPSLQDVDLSAGVKNSVVGSGAEGTKGASQ